MLNLAERAVEAALSNGASYADARANRVRREEWMMRNGDVASLEASEDFGLGVRVLVDGAFGFAAAPLDVLGATDAEKERVARSVARRAAEVARALRSCMRQPVRLAGRASARGEYTTPVAIDPFTLAMADKIRFLADADRALEGASATIVRESALSFRHVEQWQASSEGGLVHQSLVRTGAGIACLAAAHGEVQRRSYPASFGGNYLSGGFERALAFDLPRHGSRVRDEAAQLCAAEPCPAGRRALILASNQLMLQIHESVGHADELDRVMGHEADLAGASFATPEKLGSFRFGSPIVTFVADPTLDGGLDTRGFDDEGVPSRPFDVVRDGVFVGYHTSREWAARVGDAHSRSTARADGWSSPPIVRITNLSLAPGTWSLDALIADTQDGVLCDTAKMWSIDERRVNFQFTTEIGWEIKDGRLGRIVRDPTYQGSTPEFWRSCDAICDERHWELWGIQNCGKGNPMQVLEMSHGASPARFRDVQFVR